MSKETAEEKLLKMMQKTGAPAAGKSATPEKKKISFNFTIQTLNQLLVLGIIVCAVALVLEMKSGMALLNQQVDFSDDARSSRAIATAALPSNKDAKFYLDKITVRNIFRPYEAQSSGKTPTVTSLAKRMAQYKLVGVAWLDLPNTASIMIEDTEGKATYFLKQGEQLEGVTVKTIYTDRVVFEYENEETTIKL